MLVADSPHRDQQGQSRMASSGALYLWPSDGLSAREGRSKSRRREEIRAVLNAGGGWIAQLPGVALKRIEKLWLWFPRAPWPTRRGTLAA